MYFTVLYLVYRWSGSAESGLVRVPYIREPFVRAAQSAAHREELR